MTLLLTPLSIERKYLMNSLQKRGVGFESFQVSCGDKKISAHQNKKQGLVLAEGGHGKTQFGIQTQFWLQNLKRIDRIITLGAAGALCQELKPLDLLIVEEIIEHDYHSFFTPKAKSPRFKTSPMVLTEEKNFPFEIKRGALASGDEDIVSVKRAEDLFEKTRALAVAWESAGGIRSAQFNNIPYFEIRGITDNARENVAEDFKQNLEIVMDHLAEFVLFLLSR